MRLMSTTESLTDSLGEIVSGEYAISLDHPALAMYPLRLYRVEPWTLLGKQTGYYAHPTTAALFASRL
jgi:hypothetical protein